jgi:hypothetical protein
MAAALFALLLKLDALAAVGGQGPAVILLPERALRASLLCHNQRYEPGTVLARGIGTAEGRA